MSYHLKEIRRGVYGELSKIQEELDEVMDAEEQKNPIMVLCELSDLIGAIEGFLDKYHKDLSLNDLLKMNDATKRAFASGRRK